MPLLFSFDEAVQRTIDAILAFQPVITPSRPTHTLWVTTSAEPCIFCLAMEQLSRSIFLSVPPGMPQVMFGEWTPRSKADFVLIQPGPSFHRNCQCHPIEVSSL